jgi:predicted ATPase
MLQRIAIRGFKSLREVDVQLAPVVVLFGPNAVGKSNLLEAILLAARLATERTVADTLTPPMRGYPLEAFSLPSGGLPGLYDQAAVSMSVEVEVTTAEQSPTPLRYRVGIEATPSSGEVVVVDEYLARLTKDGTLMHKPRIEKADDHLVVRRLKERGQPRKEPLRLNHTLVSNPQLSGDMYPDFDRVRNEVRSWRFYYLDPAGAMREPRPPQQVDDIGVSGGDIAPFLYRLRGNEQYAKRFSAVSRALRTAIPGVERLDVVLDKERGTLDIRIVQDGTEYSSRIMSEGTLRVLALCAISANPWPNSLVAFEEPENGVHPRRIEVIADLLSSLALREKRQVIITTHSPTFVSAMLRRSRQPEYEGNIRFLRCVRSGAATQLEPFDDPRPLFEDKAIREALRGSEDPTDEEIVTALLLRGWLDA